MRGLQREFVGGSRMGVNHRHAPEGEGGPLRHHAPQSFQNGIWGQGGAEGAARLQQPCRIPHRPAGNPGGRCAQGSVGRRCHEQVGQGQAADELASEEEAHQNAQSARQQACQRAVEHRAHLHPAAHPRGCQDGEHRSPEGSQPSHSKTYFPRQFEEALLCQGAGIAHGCHGQHHGEGDRRGGHGNQVRACGNPQEKQPANVPQCAHHDSSCSRMVRPVRARNTSSSVGSTVRKLR